MFFISSVFVRKFVGQVSDEAIRVETMFFLGSVLYGHEAMIAEDTDFKCEGEGEEVVKKNECPCML